MFKPKKPSLDDYFEKLVEMIEVPSGRQAAAERSYRSVGEWLSRDQSILQQLSPSVYVQGSFALGTAIKPLTDDNEYDIDAVCQLNWDKSRYSQEHLKELLGRELQAYTESRKMGPPEPARRCWTLNYAEDAQFHMDVLPAVPDDIRQKSILERAGYNMGQLSEYVQHAISITDNTHPHYTHPSLEWFGSNPKGYRNWFISQIQNLLNEKKEAAALNRRTTVDKVPDYDVKTPLQQVIQLLKRHRDVMFSEDEDNRKPISIIITTLATHAYNQERSITQALIQVVNGMADYIQSRNGVLWVENPVDPRENFADKWPEHPERKEAFFEWLEELKADVKVAAEATNIVITDLINHLAPRLGHKPVEDAAKAFFPSSVASSALSSAQKNLILKADHKQKPKWKIISKNRVKISKAILMKKPGYRPIAIKSNGPALPKNRDLLFTAKTNVKQPYDIFWQIVNTGEDARLDGKLRGGFEEGKIEKGRLKKIEGTSYTGSHSIECFIVKNGYCVAKSGPFIVNIE